MTLSTDRRPGITFLAEPPRPTEALPRMDIAAFVGLASSGPIHTPVAVEDVGSFREIFGGDLPLAWDDEQGRLQHALLGPAIEAFFRNGGRRCWVVRVAGDAGTARFHLPGLVASSSLADAEPSLAEAWARSAGSWAEELRVSTVLRRRTIRTAQGTSQVFGADASAYRLEVGLGASELRSGDLLEVAFGDDEPLLYLFIDRVVAGAESLRVEGATGFWFESPQIAPSEEVAEPVWIAATDGLDAAASLAAVAPSVGEARAQRLDFELLVWRGDELERRFGGLAFTPEHPRYWGYLPSDAAVFASSQGRMTTASEIAGGELLRQAREPRFPLAGPAGEATVSYLPLGMSSAPDAGSAVSAVDRGTVSPLELDGLATFGAELFLDADLARFGAGSLRSEAQHKHSLLQQQLLGLHSLWAVEEVTMVALPDAVHRGWSRIAPALPNPLPAPRFAVAASDSADGAAARLAASWSAVSQATAYRLERSTDIAFEPATTVYEGPELRHDLQIDGDCPETIYLRVSAVRSGRRGPFSDSVALTVPRPVFVDCSPPPPAARELQVSAIGPASRRLDWTGDAAAVDYELVEARDGDFATAVTIYRGTKITAEVTRSDGLYYYRVRAHGPQGPGAWSGGVEVRVATREAWVTRPRTEYEDHDLLALHRATLRFSAARGDLLAVLALPDHYRDEGARFHVGALSGGSTQNLASGVPPLTQGERGVLGFGALYHPWLADLATAGDPRGETLRRVPPEGAVCGVAASKTLAQGAWVAPANQPLRATIGLAPSLSRGEESRLASAGINLIHQDPRGFLALGADTLNRDADLRPISVRRLLILLRRLALREGASYVFEPSSDDFRRLVSRRFEDLLGDLFTRGALAGRAREEAFRVIADESLNPPQSLDAGRFILELRVAPARPLAFLTVRLVQTGPDVLAIQEV